MKYFLQDFIINFIYFQIMHLNNKLLFQITVIKNGLNYLFSL